MDRGLPPAPAASQVRVGFGAKPQGLVFVLKVVRVDVTVQKRSKNVHFRIFATKNTANLAISDPTPHANRGE